MAELKESIEECVPREHPWQRPNYIEAEVQAVRACYNGTAGAQQQRLAVDFLLRAYGTDDLSYRPERPYDTAFAEGKRFAGTILKWIVKSATTRTDPDKIAVRNIDNE